MASTCWLCGWLLLVLVSVSIQQPPGVPPRQQPHHGQPQQQQYQQPPQQHEHSQQYQQPPQQHQQPPQQHQQPPQQQQTADGHGHGHSGHAEQAGDHGHGKPLEFASEIHNRDHILEHLQKVVSTKPKDQLTPEELEFHYFKLHDYDNNNQLDGLEIAKAMTHTHPATDQNKTASDAHDNVPVMSDEALAGTVDGILSTFDHDKNGYVEYFEFKKVSQVSGSESKDGA
ncbi:hypothetical protein BsWGS_09822 [Bradybaena similaris]